MAQSPIPIIGEPSEELRAEAAAIENAAADVSYQCEFGVSEWEAFLGESGWRLAELAKLGYGTWAREGHIPAPWSPLRVANQ